MSKEAVKQSGARFSVSKSYRTSKRLLFLLYIAREGTVLTTRFKVTVTKVRQITQTVTTLYRLHLQSWMHMEKRP